MLAKHETLSLLLHFLSNCVRPDGRSRTVVIASAHLVSCLVLLNCRQCPCLLQYSQLGHQIEERSWLLIEFVRRRFTTCSYNSQSASLCKLQLLDLSLHGDQRILFSGLEV